LTREAGGPSMGSTDDDMAARARAYRRDLESMGRECRMDFVDMARRNEEWPQPSARYLAAHARKWGLGRQGPAYAQWAYEIKNGPGVLVLAYIHHVHRNRGLAFVDHQQDAIVLFDVEENQNRDVFSPLNGSRRWVTDKTANGTHWRLKDTER
jgi:hypothetical protein